MLSNHDDINKIEQIDKSHMLQAIKSLPDHLKEAFDLAKKPIAADNNINSIVFFGLGGSATAEEVTCQLLRDEVKIPLITSKSSSLPAFANEKTLCIIVSYSGNTKETLCCYRDAIQRNCQIVAITSGGELANLCKKNQTQLITVQQGCQPRAALGLLLGAILGLFQDISMINLRETVHKTHKLITALSKDYDNFAKKIAQDLFQQTSVIYASETLGIATANRWKNQLNENAKVIAYCNFFPELSHNEIMSDAHDQKPTIVYLHNPDEKADQLINNRLSLKLMKEQAEKIIEIPADGETLMEKILSLIIIGDYISTYLAILKEVDPSPVERIMKLKEQVKQATTGKQVASSFLGNSSQ